MRRFFQKRDNFSKKTKIDPKTRLSCFGVKSKPIDLFLYHSCLRFTLSIYADIPEYNTEAGGTIPPSLTVTADKPDIVIIDEKKKAAAIFELTVPFEHNIEARNTYKNDKYEYLKEDITHYKTQIVAFEIGARGYISRENRKRLKLIHKFCKTEIKIKEFEENIARLSINASYYIYLCRDQTEWVTPPLLSP